ncbi:MAG: tocopherol cyclase family protein [Butyricicoccaceae bacterium]
MKEAGFCGWYYKMQRGKESAALIAAVCGTGAARRGSIQVLTPEGSLWFSLPGERCFVDPVRPRACMGASRFSPAEIRLDLRQEGHRVGGCLRFGPGLPPQGDVMGPFGMLPFLGCRHTVWSMRHRVDGWLQIDGRRMVFDGGTGYIEGDRGRVFPRRYLWTQCLFDSGSLTAAVADLPIPGPARLTGTAAMVTLAGREYRLATYRGARLLAWGPGYAALRQDDLLLTVRCRAEAGHWLRAPARDGMTRTVREAVRTSVSYRLWQKDRLLLALDAADASFEQA